MLNHKKIVPYSRVRPLVNACPAVPVSKALNVAPRRLQSVARRVPVRNKNGYYRTRLLSFYQYFDPTTLSLRDGEVHPTDPMYVYYGALADAAVSFLNCSFTRTLFAQETALLYPDLPKRVYDYTRRNRNGVLVHRRRCVAYHLPHLFPHWY